MTDDLRTIDVPYPDFDGTQTCAAEDPELFFTPEQDAGPGNRHNSQRMESAQRACRGCPWIRECLGYAIAHDVQGVWGGTSKAERDAIRREHGIRARPLAISDQAQMREDIRRLNALGMSPTEIAAGLGCSPQSVYEQRRRTEETGGGALSASEIANRLGISSRTVVRHRSRRRDQS